MTACCMKRSPRRRIQPWVLGPLLFFCALAGFQVVLVVLITGHDVDQVEPDAYTRSLSFDEEQAARARFVAGDFALFAATPGGRQVEFRLQAPDDAGDALEAVALDFYRPDDADLDQHLRWEDLDRPLALQLPRSGVWEITLTARYRGEDIRHGLRLVVD